MNQPPRQRRRVTFEATKEVYERVRPLGPGEKSAFLNRAVRAQIAPPCEWKSPTDPDVLTSDITAFLGGAEHEIIFVGLSLHRLLTYNRQALEQRIDNYVPLTFVTLRSPEPSGFLSMLLQKMLGEDVFVDDIRSQVQQSHDVIRSLRARGRRNGTLVKLLCCEELPTNGLIIRDHNKPTARMRVNFYTQWRVRRHHPVLEIDPTLREGKVAYDVFYEYGDALMSRAYDVFDSMVQAGLASD